MRTSSMLVVVALAVSALCACGGGESTPVDAPEIDAPDLDAPDIDAVPIDAPVDAAVDAPSGPCNPTAAVGQQGCIAGQKCTWINVQDTPVVLGRLGCVPDGNVQSGGVCVEGPTGETTGYDDCAAGLICISGECVDVCGFDGTAPCANGYDCSRYVNVFANGEDDPVAGVCSATCDPLTQLRFDAATCGTNKGCYVMSSQTRTIAVCAPAGTVAAGQSISSPAPVNVCVPGAQPRVASPAGGLECGGLCRVTDVTSTMNMTSEGGVEPDSCVTRWGAAPPADATQGESCRYWWARELSGDLTPYSNTLGWCFKHAVYENPAGGVFPRCIDLTTGDVVPPIGNPPHNDAMYFWCLALPSSFQLWSNMLRPAHANQPVLDRLADWRR